MLQFPIRYLTGIEPPPRNGFEQFVGFFVLYLGLLSLMGFALPRLWFLWCVRPLFPLLPERLEEKADD